jgi:sulfur-carrier protein adenylyltransferase/sulfurtransferase
MRRAEAAEATGAVLLVGAGGLGCGAALALAAAGVRRLGVVDDDVVDETNLHRQVLHRPRAVGSAKVDSLAATLRERFPAVLVEPHRERFDAGSAAGLLARYDVLVDGSDNLATKFLCNDAAVLAGKPLVHGAAVGTMGQIVTVPAGGRPCYRCLFEELPPPSAEAPSCAEAGVLGPVPGVIGALQGAEAARLVSGGAAAGASAGASAFAGRLLRYDSPSFAMRIVRFRPNPACAVCGASPTIRALKDSASVAEECNS